MPGRAPRFFQRYPKVTLAGVILVAGALLIIAVEAALHARYEGLNREQHAYLEILDGPLYEGVPGAAAIRDIWAGVEGSNACGPDRLDVRYADCYLYAPAPFCDEHLTIEERHGERATVNPETPRLKSGRLLVRPSSILARLTRRRRQRRSRDASVGCASV